MKTNPNLKDNHYLNSNLKVQNNPISYEINTNIWEYKFQNNFGYAPSSLFSVHLDELIFIRLFCKSTVVPWKRWCFTELYIPFQDEYKLNRTGPQYNLKVQLTNIKIQIHPHENKHHHISCLKIPSNCLASSQLQD